MAGSNIVTPSGAAPQKPVVRIETTTAGHPTLGYMRALTQISNAAMSGVTPYIPIMPNLYKCADIPMGRNLAVEADLKPERPWDYWLWFDDDEVCLPEDIAYLVEDMERDPNLMMVAGIVSRVSEEHYYGPVLFNGYDPAYNKWTVWFTGWEEPKLYTTEDHPMWYGTGFTMMRRCVFERLSKPWYAAMPNKMNRKEWVGHDLAFCDRLQKEGMKIGVDSRCTIGHHKHEYVFPRSHYIGQGYREKFMTHVASQQLIKKSEREDMNTKEFWDAAYEQAGTDSWLEYREGLLNEITNIIPEGANVLQFGCGTGYFLEHLAKTVPDITIRGVDVSEVAVARANNRGATATVAPLAGFSPNGDIAQYDVVLIIDWLERLPDPHKTLKRLAQTLKPNGLMIIVAAECMHAQAENHHVISKENIGPLIRDVGGRPVEITPYTEPLTGPNGKPFAHIKRLITRAVFKEKEHGAHV